MDDVACEFARSKDAQKQLTRTSLNYHKSFNLGRGQSRDHLSRANCQQKIILQINKQLKAKVSGKRLNLEKLFKTSHVRNVSETNSR